MPRRRRQDRARGPAHRRPLAPRRRQYALPRQGQARDLPLHGRRAEPNRSLRPETRAQPKYDGFGIPAEIVKDQRYAFINADAALMASPFAFAQHGESGAEISEMLPHLAEVVDDIAIVKSVHTDQFNHAPAQYSSTPAAPPRSAQHGLLGHLRPRQRNRGPPRLHRAQLRRGHERRRGELELRLHAHAIPGRAVPLAGRGRAERRQPRRRRRRPATRLARSHLRPEPHARRTRARSRNRRAHRRLRNGLPHADQRPGSPRPSPTSPPRRSNCTARNPEQTPSRTTASSRGGSSSAASAS
jgi:hypothetical protein